MNLKTIQTTQSAINACLNHQHFSKALLQTALQEQLPIAFWRLPFEQEQHAVISFEPIIEGKIHIENSEKGFIISPFLNPENQHSFFIKADWHFQLHAQRSFQVENRLFSMDSQEKQAIFYQKIPEFLESSERISIPNTLATNTITPRPEAQIYQQNVKKATEAISQKKFQKVVLSRLKTVPLAPDFDIWEVFEKLIQRYQNALVYIFYIPQKALWIGATPEILIQTTGKIFKTMALAGTQAHKPEVPIPQTLWTQKEIEEQAMVSRYIINCFKLIRLREFEEEGPKTVVAGNLRHLRTMFSVDMEEVNFQQLGSVMIDLLHPTSAVCGLPKEPALEFIQNHEPHARRFYSGFLGPVQIGQQSNLFVNLRCMEITPTQAILYAGAGITEDSVPEKEWAETEMKCQTMLAVLDNAKG